MVSICRQFGRGSSRPNYKGVEKLKVDEFTARKLYNYLAQKQPMNAGAFTHNHHRCKRGTRQPKVERIAMAWRLCKCAKGGLQHIWWDVAVTHTQITTGYSREIKKGNELNHNVSSNWGYYQRLHSPARTRVHEGEDNLPTEKAEQVYIDGSHNNWG
jgi:hypothetical protein